MFTYKSWSWLLAYSLNCKAFTANTHNNDAFPTTII